jgi:hypothetical protein
MALTSFSGPPPTAWHEPLAVQPSQELEGKALTQVPVLSILITIPCSVATISVLSVLIDQLCNCTIIISGGGNGNSRFQVSGVRVQNLGIANLGI